MISRTKILEHKRCVEQLYAQHEVYLCKQHKIPEVLREQFSNEEIEVLEKHGAWLSSLASGELRPNAYGQVRFIAVTKGILRPRSELERIWVKYQRMVRR